MINSKDISVVVQGPVMDNITNKVLESIRKFLPDSEIILSTWEGSNVDGLSYDVCVLSKDFPVPLSRRTDGRMFPNNINRQILSTGVGLKKANRKYCLKLRSDLILNNNSFCNYFHKFQKRNEKYSFFKSKVVIPSVYTKLYSHVNGKKVPYHPSDWCFFGLSEDLKKYFDVEFATDENYFNWQDKFKDISVTPYPTCNERYFTEQFFFINAFSKKFDLQYDDLTCWNNYNFKLWKKLLVNNFIVIDTKNYGIYSLKYPSTQYCNNGIDKSFKGLVYEDEYELLYNEEFHIFLFYLIKFLRFLYSNRSTKDLIYFNVCGIKLKHKLKTKKKNTTNNVKKV